MAVIEVAMPGLEATSYELLVTVGNACNTVNGIISTQLLTPLKSAGCEDDTGNCASDTVNVNDKSSYQASHGPSRFTNYTLVLTSISLTACFIFTRFLPASKEECHLWRLEGERTGESKSRGRISLILAFIIIMVR